MSKAHIYSISFWYYINPQPINTGIAYTKYTNILTYGNKPAIQYNAEKNMVRIQTQTGTISSNYEEDTSASQVPGTQAPGTQAPAAQAAVKEAVAKAPEADIKFNIFKNDMKKERINNISFEEYKKAINIQKKLKDYDLNLKEIIIFDRIKRPKKYKNIKETNKRNIFKEAFKKISYKYLYRKYKTKYLKLKNILIIN